MYQNKVTLIGFLAGQQRRSSQQRQLHNSLAGDQVLLQKERRVYLAHGMAPLRGVRQTLGVRQNAQ